MSFVSDRLQRAVLTLARGHWLSAIILVSAATLVPGCFNCSSTANKPCDPTVAFPNPGACPDPNIPTGDPGGKCAGWPQNCESGSVCYQNTCIPCGGPGEICCQLGSCDGSTCKSQPSGPKLCDGTCGQAGQPCCGANDHCDNGNVCDDLTDICVSVLDPACNGSTTYYVPGRVIANGCAYTNFIVNADSPAEATQCAEKGLADLNHTGAVELLTPQLTPNNGTTYQFCQTSSVNPGGVNVEVNAHSYADAQSCVAHLCVNCQHTDGACP